ncbi:MAG TPA: phage terminase large subunit [Candidatus Sulfotelmatobacter sp.]|nr:phage terminase large subunit [Candidatus Sulfotelmatobacter sp.]
MEAAETIFKPQPGPQTDFLRCSADICIFGGAAGGGKSHGLLLDHCYHIENRGYRGVTLRKTVPQLRAPGGLWDKSKEIYPLLRAEPREQTHEWLFPSGAIVKFGAIEFDADVYSWDGSEICGLQLDEGTQFSEFQFFHMISRNRSTCGIKPYVRVTTNPDPDSWLRRFLSYWIDEATGYPIPERCGKLRWFVRRNDELFWADSPQELIEKFGKDASPKSVTFIPSFVQNNAKLLEVNPEYIGNLKALPSFERDRLLLGNWNARPQAGSYFKREWFGTPLDTLPSDIVARVRFWDRAGTEQAPGRDPDATVGLKLAKTRQGLYIVEDVVRIFETPHGVESKMIECAKADGFECVIGFMSDPGSAGKYESTAATRALDGFTVKIIPSSGAGSKETRARPISSQCEAGNCRIIRAPWNETFLRELEAFPFGRHDDRVDGLTRIFHKGINQRSGWSVHRLDFTKPNENATRRFFDNRL